MRWLLIWMACLGLVSCVEVAPNLKLPEPRCNQLKLVLPPVPNDVELSVKGDAVRANAGGEAILRGYVSARRLLR